MFSWTICTIVFTICTTTRSALRIIELSLTEGYYRLFDRSLERTHHFGSFTPLSPPSPLHTYPLILHHEAPKSTRITCTITNTINLINYMESYDSNSNQITQQIHVHMRLWSRSEGTLGYNSYQENFTERPTPVSTTFDHCRTKVIYTQGVVIDDLDLLICLKLTQMLM